MKKLSLAVLLSFGMSMPVFAEVGVVVASDPDKAQTVALAQSGDDGALAFTTFNITVSKGVSLITDDDTSGSSPAVTVGAKHLNSLKQFGGTTAGGSISLCSGDGPVGDIVAVPDDADCNTSGT